MPPKLIVAPVQEFDRLSSFQPRTHFDPAAEQAFLENIATHGQQVPGICWLRGERYAVADGNRRLKALIAAGRPTFMALLLEKEPSSLDLKLAQASIDLHKQHLPPVDRARLFQSIHSESGLNGKQVAASVGISPSVLSRYLPLLDLAPDLQELVNSGGLEWTKGSAIAQATKDPDEQRQMAKVATGMTRDAFTASVRKAREGAGQEQPGSASGRMRIPLASDTASGVVTLTGDSIDFTAAEALLKEALRALRTAKEKRLSVTAAQKMWRNVASAGQIVAENEAAGDEAGKARG